jgi:hypothetical protein
MLGLVHKCGNSRDLMTAKESIILIFFEGHLFLSLGKYADRNFPFNYVATDSFDIPSNLYSRILALHQLGAKTVTRSMFLTKGPQILVTTVTNAVASANSCPEFVHFCIIIFHSFETTGLNWATVIVVKQIMTYQAQDIKPRLCSRNSVNGKINRA